VRHIAIDEGEATMAIHDLANHTAPYVTVRELAEYWRVSQKQIRQRVSAGHLSGLRLGPRICRISVTSALAFERASEQALSQRVRTNRGLTPGTDRPDRRRPY
jgi:excisionase family DNA binding protein